MLNKRQLTGTGVDGAAVVEGDHDAAVRGERPAPSRVPGEGREPELRSQPMLEIVDVVHRYGDVVALDNISVRAATRRVPDHPGRERLGQDDAAAHHLGPRAAEPGSSACASPARTLRRGRRRCATAPRSSSTTRCFPHMSVGENVELRAKVRGVPARRAARRRRSRRWRWSACATSRPRRVHQLSGGERQRVALARALVTRPAILLLDEPLGALDEKLRLEMQIELVDLHRKLGMTFVYITHSQEEALTMSDRVILMRRGRIEQSGTPATLFDRPVSRFVAEFMGFENVLPAVVEDVSGAQSWRVAVAGRTSWPLCGRGRRRAAGRWRWRVRAERRAPRPRRDPHPAPGRTACRARRRGSIYKGKYVDQVVETPVGPLKARIWDTEAATETFDRLSWAATHCRSWGLAGVAAAPSSRAETAEANVSCGHEGEHGMSDSSSTEQLTRRDLLKALPPGRAPPSWPRRSPAPPRWRMPPTRWSAAMASPRPSSRTGHHVEGDRHRHGVHARPTTDIGVFLRDVYLEHLGDKSRHLHLRRRHRGHARPAGLSMPRSIENNPELTLWDRTPDAWKRRRLPRARRQAIWRAGHRQRRQLRLLPGQDRRQPERPRRDQLGR